MAPAKTARSASSPKPPATSRRARRYCKPQNRWRPADRSGGACNYTLDGETCKKRGAHYCEPRADKVVKFFAEVLVHTKGPFARHAFVLRDWQENEIIRPLFGEVLWSHEWQRYVRRYRVAYIVISRKNGKSELAAGIALYLLVGDDEEAAEVYGAAKDTKQARKVWEPAERMRSLSPVLNSELGGRLGVNKHEKRIFDEKTASFYEIITADAEGELGHNPHGFILDEVLSQRDRTLWDAMTTAKGARTQSLFVAITTEVSDSAGFGASLIDEAERAEADPASVPHIFAYVRKTPADADPWNEKNWHHANPALGQFLSLKDLRDAALEARLDPVKENSFRQFKLNQRVQQMTRHMPLALWDASAGLVKEDKLAGRPFFGGLDMASTTDLAAWALVFPGPDFDEVLWRFWTPEAQLPLLDRYTSGRASTWVKQGHLYVTEGDWIDFDAIETKIDQDLQRFEVRGVGYDKWGAVRTAQWLDSQGVEVEAIPQGYALSPALKEIMRLVKAGRWRHGGHPVARWNADGLEVRQDDGENIKPVKPDRKKAASRIDGYVASAMAKTAQMRSVAELEGAVNLW